MPIDADTPGGLRGLSRTSAEAPHHFAPSAISGSGSHPVDPRYPWNRSPIIIPRGRLGASGRTIAASSPPPWRSSSLPSPAAGASRGPQAHPGWLTWWPENFGGNVAAQIGGDHVRVTSIISKPNQDPHEYEAAAAAAAAVAQAELVIENGAGYDDFLGQLLSAAGGSRTLMTVQRVLGITARR